MGHVPARGDCKWLVVVLLPGINEAQNLDLGLQLLSQGRLHLRGGLVVRGRGSHVCCEDHVPVPTHEDQAEFVGCEAVREEAGEDVVFVSSVLGHVHVDEGVVTAGHFDIKPGHEASEAGSVRFGPGVEEVGARLVANEDGHPSPMG